MAKLKVTLRKSAIGYAPNQRRTIRALDLRRLGQTVEHGDSPAIRGMIHTVRHLIEVQEVAE